MASLNGMTLMAMSPEIKYISRASAFALAVWLDLRLARERPRKPTGYRPYQLRLNGYPQAR